MLMGRLPRPELGMVSRLLTAGEKDLAVSTVLTETPVSTGGAGVLPPEVVVVASTNFATTRQTVCRRAVVSAWPSAGSRRQGSSRAVTRRCHTSSHTRMAAAPLARV